MSHLGPLWRRHRRLFFAALLHYLTFGNMTSSAQSVGYPPSRRGTVVDSLHGTVVADPYRWLEDLNSAETAQWIDAQNRLSSSYLAKIPAREAFRARITTLMDFARITLPTRLDNGVLFYRRNTGLQKQFVVLARSSPTTTPKTIIDPNTLSPDGNTALSQFEPSPDGRHVAYALSPGGADWQDVRVRVVRTGQDLDDVLRWVRFSELAWTKDGKGF
ncbi:MAG: S9 family peptidase, partial [Gemmatimonadaceae bacterium]